MSPTPNSATSPTPSCRTPSTPSSTTCGFVLWPGRVTRARSAGSPRSGTGSRGRSSPTATRAGGGRSSPTATTRGSPRWRPPPPTRGGSAGGDCWPPPPRGWTCAVPFADLIPEALAHTLDLDLRIVQPDPRTPGALTTIALHAGGTGDPHVAYNGTDHFDALVPDTDPSRATTPESAPEPVSASALQPAPDGSDPYGDWLREMAGITDTAPETADEGDRTPLETQLDRYRPPRLLTGPDARRPGPAPRTVTFEDGSRLPAALIRPGADPGDTDADGTPPGAEPTGLFAGTGVLTLRAPELAARQILDGLPDRLRARFDEEELLRLLTDQPSAFTAPRGARLVGREKSGVGLEMTVEAVPYHRWVRLSDTGGGTVKADTARRGQSGTGGGRTVGFGRRIAGALSMGPPLDWLLKIGASLGWARRTDYNQGTTAYQQAEHRAHEGSHLHLDDVHYRVRVHRVTEAPRAAAPAITGGTPGTRTRPVSRRAPLDATAGAPPSSACVTG
ncbi:hypothetical protein ACFQV4_29220 [Streptomyces thermocarboxydus]